MTTDKVTLDINCGVSCELTDAGMGMVKDYYHQKIPVQAEKHIDLDRKEITNMPMWQFMKIFGPHMFEGMIELPFKDNSITIVEPPG